MRESEFAGLTFKDNSEAGMDTPAAYLITDSSKGKSVGGEGSDTNLKYVTPDQFESMVRENQIYNFRWKDGAPQYNVNISEHKGRTALLLGAPPVVAAGVIISDQKKKKHFFDMEQRRFLDQHVKQAIVSDEYIAAGVYNCVVKGEKTAFGVCYFGKNVGAYINFLRSKYPNLEKFIQYKGTNNASAVIPFRLLLNEEISTGEFKVLYCTQILSMDPKTRARFIQKGSSIKFESELQQVKNKLDQITAENSKGMKVIGSKQEEKSTSVIPTKDVPIDFNKKTKMALSGLLYSSTPSSIYNPTGALLVSNGVYQQVNYEQFIDFCKSGRLVNISYKNGEPMFNQKVFDTAVSGGTAAFGAAYAGATGLAVGATAAATVATAGVAAVAAGGIVAASGALGHKLAGDGLNVYKQTVARFIDKHVLAAENSSEYLAVSVSCFIKPDKFWLTVYGKDVAAYLAQLKASCKGVSGVANFVKIHNLDLGAQNNYYASIAIPASLLVSDQLACGRKLLFNTQLFANQELVKELANSVKKPVEYFDALRQKLDDITRKNLGDTSGDENLKAYCEKYGISESQMPAELERLKTVFNVSNIDQVKEQIAVLI